MATYSEGQYAVLLWSAREQRRAEIDDALTFMMEALNLVRPHPVPHVDYSCSRAYNNRSLSMNEYDRDEIPLARIVGEHALKGPT